MTRFKGRVVLVTGGARLIIAGSPDDICADSAACRGQGVESNFVDSSFQISIR